MNPEHVSVYQLILEEGTPFYETYAEHPELLPDEEVSREIYLSTGRMLSEAGYEQYEISNYARFPNSGMRCVHGRDRKSTRLNSSHLA